MDSAGLASGRVHVPGRFRRPASAVAKKPSTLRLWQKSRRESVKESAEVSAMSFTMNQISLLADRQTAGGPLGRVPARHGKSLARMRCLLRASGLGLLLSLGCVTAQAFDGTKTPADDPSPMQAFRNGTKAYKAGDLAGASQALEFAASKGHALAQWKLARMYSEGDGVPRDDKKAFETFKGANGSSLAEDLDGDLVYMARNQFTLDYTRERAPAIAFADIKDLRKEAA